MNVLNCPYCHKAMSMPPPKDAGRLFDCIHCGSAFRFTGAGALPPPVKAPRPSRPSFRLFPQLGQTGDVAGLLKGLAILGVLCVILAPILTPNIESSFRLRDMAAADNRPDLELIESSADQGGVYGTVRNNTGRNYGYVQVSVTLYAEDGAVVGSTMDNVNNLGPHEVWRFKAYPFTHYARYRVQDVTGF